MCVLMLKPLNLNAQMKCKTNACSKNLNKQLELTLPQTSPAVGGATYAPFSVLFCYFFYVLLKLHNGLSWDV